MKVFSISFQPFGEGLVTVTVPPLRRGENSLSLWNILNISSPVPSPVNTFVGHSDVVLEFQWRSQIMEGETIMGRAVLGREEYTKYLLDRTHMSFFSFNVLEITLFVVQSGI